MVSEILKLTTEIVVSHASMSELSTQQLVKEIKDIYNTLTSLETDALQETVVFKGETEVVKKQPILLKDIVKEKYVVCLDCGRKMRTLKAHIRKAHSLTPKEYCKRYGLDPKTYPLVCKEYSLQRSKLAVEKGLGALRRKAEKTQ